MASHLVVVPWECNLNRLVVVQAVSGLGLLAVIQFPGLVVKWAPLILLLQHAGRSPGQISPALCDRVCLAPPRQTRPSRRRSDVQAVEGRRLQRPPPPPPSSEMDSPIPIYKEEEEEEDTPEECPGDQEPRRPISLASTALRFLDRSSRGATSRLSSTERGQKWRANRGKARGRYLQPYRNLWRTTKTRRRPGMRE